MRQNVLIGGGPIEVEDGSVPMHTVDVVYPVSDLHSDILVATDGKPMFFGNPNDSVSDDGVTPSRMWVVPTIAMTSGCAGGNQIRKVSKSDGEPASVPFLRGRTLAISPVKSRPTPCPLAASATQRPRF